MSLRDVLAFFGVTRDPVDHVVITPTSLGGEAQGVQRLPVPVMHGVIVRGFYEQLVYDDSRRQCIISTHDSLRDGFYVQETEAEVHGFQPEDRVEAYLRFLADWEAAHP